MRSTTIFSNDCFLCGIQGYMGPEARGGLLSGQFPRVEQNGIVWGITGRLGWALPSCMVQILETFYSYLQLSPHSLGDCCCGDLQGRGMGGGLCLKQTPRDQQPASCFFPSTSLHPLPSTPTQPQGAEPRHSPKAWGVFI